jgi:hypothetical protein
MVGQDELPAESLQFAPALENAIGEFEKALWRINHSQTEPYKPSCDCTFDQCQQHRALGDQIDKCNDFCCRWRLYAYLETRDDDGHRQFVLVRPENPTDWSSLAAALPSVSFIRFGGGGFASGPVNEKDLVGALRKFFARADGLLGNGATP